MELSTNQHKFDFDGPVYSKEFDKERLTGQILRVFEVMKDAKWRTLEQLHFDISYQFHKTDPISSLSAQLRHLRKIRYGSHVVNMRPKGDRKRGLWEYQLIVNKIDNKEELLNEKKEMIVRSSEIINDLQLHKLSSKTRAWLQIERDKLLSKIKDINNILKTIK